MANTCEWHHFMAGEFPGLVDGRLLRAEVQKQEPRGMPDGSVVFQPTGTWMAVILDDGHVPGWPDTDPLDEIRLSVLDEQTADALTRWKSREGSMRALLECSRDTVKRCRDDAG